MRRFAVGVLCVAITACGRSDNPKAGSAPLPSTANAVASTVGSDVPKPDARVADSRSQAVIQSPDRFNRSIDVTSDLDIVFILYDHLGQTPPFEEWADQDMTVRSANEFERGKKREARIKELQAQFAAVQGVGVIDVTISSTVSQYDATYKEYYVSAFGGGSYLTFKGFGKEVQVSFTNGLDAYAWKVEPEEAARILQKNNQSRNVKIIAQLKIESARPTQTGGAMQARIVRYSIQGTSNQGKFADITVNR